MKVRSRKLWLRVLFSVPDKNIPRQRIIDTLISSIRRGNYEYPAGWRVAIQWRNKANAPMRTGEFTEEMNASAQSSEGFDKAVLAYLEQAR